MTNQRSSRHLLTSPNRRPIAIQSQSHKFQSRSNVGHRCCFCFTFGRLISSAGLPPSMPGSRKLGWAGTHWWNSCNRRPIAVQSRSSRGIRRRNFGFQPLPAIRFGKHCLGLRRRNHSRGNFCTRPRSQNERDVRRQHATSIFMIIVLPFRGPTAGQPRVEFYQSRGSTSCRCS